MKNFEIITYISDESDGNTAFHVGLDIDDAINNRKNICKKLNINFENLISMDQTHSCNVEIVDHKSPKIIQNCDAIITNIIDLPIMVMVADCLPICIKDEHNGVISVIHSGRNGTFLRILQKTIKIMKNHFGCDENNLKIEFGPHIKSCCYEVGEELSNIAKNSFGDEFCNGNYIDLLGMNMKMAFQENIKIENIITSNICTCCSGEHYFSYRKNKKCGRFCMICSIIPKKWDEI